MRISDKKIDRIAKKLLELIEKDKNLKLLVDSTTIEAQIKAIIIEDLKEEDLIEDEAKKILDQHANIISGQNIDYLALLNKTKRQIAKQKGFVL
jgi:hypothetical protein